MSRFINKTVLLALAAVVAAMAAYAASAEPVDLQMITLIRQEGLRNSQVMDILSELADGIGPRLTGSPNMKKANEWTRDKLKEWGLENARLEAWGPFGRGWSNESVSVRMVAPSVTPLLALPKAWTPGTQGAVRGKVVRIKVEKKEDFEQYRGKLAGVIVFNGDMREVKPQSEAALVRYTPEKLAEIAQYPVSPQRRYDMAAYRRMRELQKELRKFLAQEKALALIDPSRGDGGTLFVGSGGSYKAEDANEPNLPALMMAIEHYGRISRLLDRKAEVELELDIRNRFHDDDPMQYNTLADIPGTDKKDEIVMLGAHLDSWHAGTGATDNAAGSAVVMEAARILKALDIKPRRTIRVALWTGEEQGLYGSRYHVAQHFAKRQDEDLKKEDDYHSSTKPAPLVLKPAHARLAAYFNLDNGTGMIRGIYAEENAAVAPIFQAWLEPFRDLGVTTVSMRRTMGTDHVPFDQVGLPGFQFIQDPVEYGTRTHHTNMDVYERIQREDLMQAAVVLASFAYHAAMRDEMLPRKPLPRTMIAGQEKPAEQPKPAKGKKPVSGQ